MLQNSSLGTLSQPQLLCEIFPHPPRGHPTVLAPGNVNVKCWTIIRSATNLAWFFFTAASNIIEILCPGLKAVHNQQGISCDPGPEILLTSSSLMNQVHHVLNDHLAKKRLRTSSSGTWPYLSVKNHHQMLLEQSLLKFTSTHTTYLVFLGPSNFAPASILCSS